MVQKFENLLDFQKLWANLLGWVHLTQFHTSETLSLFFCFTLRHKGLRKSLAQSSWLTLLFSHIVSHRGGDSVITATWHTVGRCFESLSFLHPLCQRVHLESPALWLHTEQKQSVAPNWCKLSLCFHAGNRPPSSFPSVKKVNWAKGQIKAIPRSFLMADGFH